MTASLPNPAEIVPLIEDAVTAPSMHNAQPWKFLYRPASGLIELYGDPGRAMPHADPDHRALHVGCAAALFNLRVSAASAGWGADVRLLPDPDVPWLLAAADLREPGPTDSELGTLHPAVRRRHSSRFLSRRRRSLPHYWTVCEPPPFSKGVAWPCRTPGTPTRCWAWYTTPSIARRWIPL